MLRVGFIGFGHRKYFIEAWLRNPRITITALAEINEQAIKEFKNLIPNKVFITNDYLELIDRPDVDAVIILTPDYLHFEHAKAAIKSKKEVFLEKPIAISIEDCDHLLYSAIENSVKVMVGFNMRYMPIYRKMYDLIQNNEIGDVKAIWVRHFVGRGGEMYFQDWHRNSKFTHSLLLQKGSHDIDIIHMLGGAYTKKVSAFGDLDFYNNEDYFYADGLENNTSYDIDVEDNNVVILELENGVKCAYLQNHFTPDYSRNYTIIGTKGRIESDDSTQSIIIKNRRAEYEETIKLNDNELIHSGADDLIVQGFVEYILDDIQPKASLLDGRMSVAVGIKATDSLRNDGIPQNIPLIEQY